MSDATDQTGTERRDSPVRDALTGDGGAHAVTVARAHGVETMFTLSGGHVFPLYNAAVKMEPPMRMVDVRHEQSAVFAAEATGKLTRTPGFAVLTAGPGVTNGVSAITQASFSGSPLVVFGGRATAFSWGKGALQELDHPSILREVTKSAATARSPEDVAGTTDEAFQLARTSHRGPTFLDVAMDHLFTPADVEAPQASEPIRAEPDPDDVRSIARLLTKASRPVLVLGTDVWLDGGESAALRLVEELGLPVITNGMGRGIIAGGHRLLVTKARSVAFGQADLVVVAGTPLDFRLGFGSFGGKDGAAAASVIHIADSAGQLATHVELAGSAYGDLALTLDAVTESVIARGRRPDWASWTEALTDASAATAARDAKLLAADADPVHPARIYGELIPRLADDAVVVGDGGDFVSFAGKFVEPRRPGCWLDPGPFGCLGAGLGAAIGARVARPSSQVVLLLGDGAAGMSLMDVDTLVRHNLPVVMIVGNNAGWALEKHPMRMLYGYDVLADLQPTHYDEIVTTLGGGGETVTDPKAIGPALDRAFDSGVPYLVNVMTDMEAVYPRATTGL